MSEDFKYRCSLNTLRRNQDTLAEQYFIPQHRPIVCEFLLKNTMYKIGFRHIFQKAKKDTSKSHNDRNE